MKTINYINIEQVLLARRIIDSNGCWLYSGYVSKQTGYGNIEVSGKKWLVHRLAARLWHPEFIESAYYCHKPKICKSTKCFNPEHIYKGDAHTNMKDRVLDGTHHHSIKTHCINGHEFTIENTRVTKAGSRRCKLCHKIETHNRRHQYKGKNIWTYKQQ